MEIEKFVEALASKQGTPGGGAACSFVAAIGVALSTMAVNLTIGKKSYQEVEKQMQEIKMQLEELQIEFMYLIEEDAKNFQPVLNVYQMPKNTEEEKKLREEAMEKALQGACKVPLHIMEKGNKAIEMMSFVIKKGNQMVKGDAIEALLLCEVALRIARMHVKGNTKSMKNRQLANQLNIKAEELLIQKRQNIQEGLQEVEKWLEEGENC